MSARTSLVLKAALSPIDKVGCEVLQMEYDAVPIQRAALVRVSTFTAKDLYICLKGLAYS